MNPWIAKAVMIAATAVMIAIRAPHGRRSRSIKTVKSHKTKRDIALMMLSSVGLLLPLIWIMSPRLSFADYPLRLAPLLAGIGCFIWGLWLFYRSHRDLGTFWSVTLEVRENHRLITEGIYRRIRHPMYAALLLYSIGQALVLPNWVAGPSYVLLLGILFVFRIQAEERMMVDTFGDQYVSYMAKTKRLVPKLW